MQLDRISRNILSILQQEARITNQDLANRVGLSPSSCLNRVRKLEEAGLIGPYLSNLNLAKICRSVEVICTVSLKDQSTDAFRAFQSAAQSHPEVVEEVDHHQPQQLTVCPPHQKKMMMMMMNHPYYSHF